MENTGLPHHEYTRKTKYYFVPRNKESGS